MTNRILSLILFFLSIQLTAQDYFFGDQKPFDAKIPSPEAFLGYKIGDQHTRHDQMVAYFYKLAEVSDRAEIEVYGYTHERRKLVMLRVSSPENLKNIDNIKQDHLQFVNPSSNVKNYDEVPVFVQLGYNVHGSFPCTLYPN